MPPSQTTANLISFCESHGPQCNVLKMSSPLGCVPPLLNNYCPSALIDVDGILLYVFGRISRMPSGFDCLCALRHPLHLRLPKGVDTGLLLQLWMFLFVFLVSCSKPSTLALLLQYLFVSYHSQHPHIVRNQYMEQTYNCNHMCAIFLLQIFGNCFILLKALI